MVVVAQATLTIANLLFQDWKIDDDIGYKRDPNWQNHPIKNSHTILQKSRGHRNTTIS
jgi:hypothetical protein